MSNSERKNKVLRSKLLSKQYKEKFTEDFDDLIMNIEVNQEEEIKVAKDELRGLGYA